jgi:indolepyruvate ferredoxin oxidoreductase
MGETFENAPHLSVQLAPPLFSRIDPATGRPRKHRFGPWIFKLFGALKHLKGLRGTAFDPFGYTSERRMERALIGDYRRMIGELLPSLASGNYEKAVAIVRTAETIRGFGPVKTANVEKARAEQKKLMGEWERLCDEKPPRPHLQAAQ